MHKHQRLTLLLGTALLLGCDHGERPLPPPVDAGHYEDTAVDVRPPPPPPPRPLQRFDGAFHTTVPVAPRPLAPLAAANVTTQRPTLRWSRPSPWVTTEVELCGDRDCQTIEQRVRVEGTSWRSETPLRPGPHHWRLWGFTADETRSAEHSHTWTLQVPGRDTDVDSAHLPQNDLDGDGYADLFMHSYIGAVVHFGSARGLSLDGVMVVSPVPPVVAGFEDEESAALLSSIGGLGDLNGDGTSEFFVTEHFFYQRDERYNRSDTRLRIMTLSPDRQPVTLLTWWSTSEYPFQLTALRGGFDADDDGYGDLIVHVSGASESSRDLTFTESHLLYGRSEGAPILSERGALPDLHTWGTLGSSYVPLGDVNGDGRIDHAVVNGLGREPSEVPRFAYTLLPDRAALSVGFEDVPPNECDQRVLASRRCDLNGDGRADHFRVSDLCRETIRVSVQLGRQGDRGQYLPLVGTPDRRLRANPNCIGDLDGDGRSEVGWLNNDLHGAIYSLNDDLQLTPWAQEAFWDIPVDVGDADGDGRAEIVVRFLNNDDRWVCHPTRATVAGDCQTLHNHPSLGSVVRWNP